MHKTNLSREEEIKLYREVIRKIWTVLTEYRDKLPMEFVCAFSLSNYSKSKQMHFKSFVRGWHKPSLKKLISKLRRQINQDNRDALIDW